MQISQQLRSELSRAFGNFKYEKASQGLYFPQANIMLGGVFGASVDDGPMAYGDNAVSNEAINGLLNAFFNQGTQPTAWFLAPFTSSATPTSALTAATFTATQSEYTGYSESGRQVWTPNGDSTAQVIGNSAATAKFTIAGSTATITGAGLLSAQAKSATSGVLAAAGMFGAANALGVGSTLTVEYSLTGTAA